MMKRYTIAELQQMRESEDHVEFKKGEYGNVSYNGAGKDKPKDRRKCILGYVTALCNEGGGRMVIGMHDKHPHQVTGTKQNENALGELESNIYRDSDIRTMVYELYEDEVNKTGRVLVIEVPSRPIGKVFKFEDVPLMRVGEDLLPMDDKTYLSIIQEQEPDFSEQFCDEATFDDLDLEAIKEMKEKYAKKQENPSFVSLDDKQALSDLHLIVGNHITNAAVLLVGKEEFINKVFPQAKVMLEYRNTEPQIHFDNRMQFGQPFFLLIDKLWDAINLRNGSVPV
jgi:ATP-dependent DNA helicase RecG